MKVFRCVVLVSLVSMFFVSAASAKVEYPLKEEQIHRREVAELSSPPQKVRDTLYRVLTENGMGVQYSDGNAYIRTEPHTFTYGYGSNVTLDKYVYLPALTFAKWLQGTVQLSLWIEPTDGGSRLILNSEFKAMHADTSTTSMFTPYWFVTESNGNYEKAFLDDIRQSLKN